MSESDWNLICFQQHGVPISLKTREATQRYVAIGMLTPRTAVDVYIDGQGTRMIAALVSQLAQFFDPADVAAVATPIPDGHATTAPPPPSRQTATAAPATAPSRPAALPRGCNISLTSELPALRLLGVRVATSPSAAATDALEIDPGAFLLGADGKVRRDEDFVFYNNPSGGGGAVDQLAGDAGDTLFRIDLSLLTHEIAKITFAIAIYDADARAQNFTMVEKAVIRVVDLESGREFARYCASRDVSLETAVILGEIYRRAGDWKFRAHGQGFTGGFAAMARSFGVDALD